MTTAKITDASFKGVTSLELVEALSCAAALISFGAHASSVVELTGLTKATVSRVARNLQRGIDATFLMRTGRLPTTLNEIFNSATLHLEASYLLRVYLNCLSADDAPRPKGAIHTHSLIRAFGAMVTLFNGAELTFGFALMVVRNDLDGTTDFTTCEKCLSSWIRLAQVRTMLGKATFGTCPVCRINNATPTIPSIDQDKDRRMALERALAAMKEGTRAPTFRIPALPSVFGSRHGGAYKPPDKSHGSQCCGPACLGSMAA